MSNPKKYYYLIHFQYSGFRYHGWQRQPGHKTIQEMLEKTFRYILGEETRFRVITSSRTDAMVSANKSAFELFTKEPVELDDFKELLNDNLPMDIKVLSVEETDSVFNIIQSSKQKEYIYLFTFGEKYHPFSAPYMTFFKQKLDVDLMNEAAKLFLGTHDFRNYCTRPSEKTKFERMIDFSEVVENDVYQANFFPENSFLFRVKGKGFLRHQVRLMMGSLVKVGRGELSLSDIKHSLSGVSIEGFTFAAPASGLVLQDMCFL